MRQDRFVLLRTPGRHLEHTLNQYGLVFTTISRIMTARVISHL